MSVTRYLLACGAIAAFTFPLAAQDPELHVNNFFRVGNYTTHPVTGRAYANPIITAPGFAAAPGVAAGTRTWTYTPDLRTQAGAQPGQYWTITGMTQGIWVGAAVLNFPAPNHYQFKCGMAPTQPGTTVPQKVHSTTAADIFSVADAPLTLMGGGPYEHAFSLGTPIVQQKVDVLLWMEFRGGEWADDPNGGQHHSCDYQSGRGPGSVAYNGFTLGGIPRTISYPTSTNYRPKTGLLIREPVMAVTGDHAQQYYSPRLQGEHYLGLGACYADWAANPIGNMFLDVRAGPAYGTSGMAVAFMNFGTWWPASLPTGFGNLLLNPSDPAFSVLTPLVMVLSGAGLYSGATNPFPVPPLGASARGQVMKVQGIVFNSGFTGIQLTTAAAVEIF